ncbi:hypothetical protein PR202_gb19491 [Eleusine coracana subsp. coracana]|uniref:Transmembrane protein n=1 Tax=Eleusine coracana subsp. coracana TaxID=191504 RepID=A0AAV5F8Z9_ELECO|nr:hypothetical protein PR202_gb19491 [Eleusine coracana subsp. coracana]
MGSQHGGVSPSSGSKGRDMFSVYQNPSVTRALASCSSRPSVPVLLVLAVLPVGSASSLLALSSREQQLAKVAGRAGVSAVAASWWRQRWVWLHFSHYRHSSGLSCYTVGRRHWPRMTRLSCLNANEGFLGLKTPGSKGAGMGEQIKRPPKAKPSTPSEPIVPIRKSSFSYTPPRSLGQSRIGSTYVSPAGERLSTAVQMSPSTPLQKSVSSPSTPWSRKSPGSAKGIQTEAMLEQFLASLDENIDQTMDSDTKTATPPVTTTSFGVATPVSVATSTTPSGATRSTPLRPVRMSPGSHQKYSTPPKKGEGELPPPMSIEQAVDAFENLGVYPEIEQWRDNLRQWFSSVVMNPLVQKIKTSHIQVKQTTATVGASVTVSQVGSDPPSTTTPVSLSPLGGTKDWQPTVTIDEDGILNQLRSALLRSRDAPVELAEGTCLRNYDYMGHGNGFGKSEKKWISELPTDSHLLLYLFAAFLEHPKWMLHVDPISYSGAQSSKNPLFLGVLPPKERFPEKYVALISGVPAIIHPGALILAVGKQNPPNFCSIYWDKKLQFSLQGRTALWDAILLLCHQINVGYGGVVRGIHIGSSALNLLSVIDSDMES